MKYLIKIRLELKILIAFKMLPQYLHIALRVLATLHMGKSIFGCSLLGPRWGQEVNYQGKISDTEEVPDSVRYILLVFLHCSYISSRQIL
jgi:hypothetical protein